MKKITSTLKSLLLIFILLNGFSCGEDNEPINISVTTIDDLFDEDESGYLILSDEDGNILASEQLFYNQTTTISNIETEGRVDATIAVLIKIDQELNYKFDHYKDVRSFDFDLCATGSNPAENIGININNFEYEEDVPFSIGHYKVTNGDATINIEFFKLLYQGNITDCFFNFRDDDNKFRYIWIEDFLADQIYNYDIDDIPIILTPSKIVNYTGLDLRSVAAYARTNENSNFVRIFKSGADQNNNVSIYTPNDIFSQFVMETTVKKSEKFYDTFQKINSINDYTYSIPDLDFELINEDPTNFILTTNGDYDYLRLQHRYVDQVNDVNIYWNSNLTDNEVNNFSIPEAIMYEMVDASIDLPQSDFFCTKLQLVKSEDYDSMDSFIEKIQHCWTSVLFPREEEISKIEQVRGNF